VFWPLGLVFGHIARRQIRRTGAGIVIGLFLAGWSWPCSASVRQTP